MYKTQIPSTREYPKVFQSASTVIAPVHLHVRLAGSHCESWPGCNRASDLLISKTMKQNYLVFTCYASLTGYLYSSIGLSTSISYRNAFVGNQYLNGGHSTLDVTASSLLISGNRHNVGCVTLPYVAVSLIFPCRSELTRNRMNLLFVLSRWFFGSERNFRFSHPDSCSNPAEKVEIH
ncbi:hypothetical protein B0H13DRAFT_1979629 [Mycena leptocephala]|nr:hypothetical protein B0H13DRAFT_1979629 [Mycena leptocephala]